MATQGKRYDIKGALQRGGMGVVFRAYDTYRGHDVALKMLPPSFLNEPDFRRRFRQETQTIIRLEHHAIVPVYDYGEQDEQPYIAMRLMGGGTLADRLANGPLPFDEIRLIMRRICSALDYAHRRNIIHRDLKPKNILFDEQGAVYLVDFGIAKLVEGTHTATFGGTPQYMAPEQINGKGLGPQTDIYQMGVVLYEMLTGGVPFSGSMSEVMLKHATAPIPSILEQNSNLPAACETIINRALAKEKDERYETAGGMARTVDQVLTTAVFSTPPLPSPPPASSPSPPAPSDTPPSHPKEETPPTKSTLVAPQAARQSQPQWAWWLGGILLLLLLVWGGSQLFGGNEPNNGAEASATAVPEVIIPLDPTSTETPTPFPTETMVPTEPVSASHTPTMESSATSQPTQTTTNTPRATPTPSATSTPSATPTPSQTPTDVPTQRPTATTAVATATLAPTATVVTQAPTLISLSSGEQQNPITFSWNGNQTLSYRVLLNHVEQGFTHNSGWIQGLSWTFDIPAEQFGVWEWVVEASNGTRSQTDGFVFNPFPNSGGSGGSSGGGDPAPVPTDPIPDP